MDISGITMAIADMPRDIFKAMSKPKSEGEASTVPPDTPASASQQVLVPTSDQASLETLSLVASDSASRFSERSSEPPTWSGAATPVTTSNLSDRHPSQTLFSGMNSSTAAISSTSGATTPQTESNNKLPKPPPPPKSRGSGSSGDGSGGFNLGSAIEAGQGVTRIVSTGVKSPMNFCLGLARGFRNAPKLYNDETVRPTEKVTDLATGIKVAGKEFGFGLYDGLSGLITQPLSGAEKEGGVGLLKGIGKGIGGLILKPAAGKFAVHGG
jgi:hypothetical protein